VSNSLLRQPLYKNLHVMLPENSNISWVLERIGNIQIENRPRPSPKPHEVEIAVKVTGICGSDGITLYHLNSLFTSYFLTSFVF
jgi:hypothetical protein